MNRAEKAKELFKSGFNCSQAVAAAFSDMIGMSEETAAKLVSGFGGGVGRMREVCGAVSGMAFVISALYGYGDPEKAGAEKAKLYERVQECALEFKSQNGSIVCRELLGLSKNSEISPVPQERNKEYFQKRPCAELVEMAAKILENYINSNKIK